MPTFSYQLEQIHQKISIKDEDRKPYTDLFDTIKNWLMDAMCNLDPLFKKLFKGTALFGSYSNNVRIAKPSEFDVSILLEFPFLINADFHEIRPGFVVLSSPQRKKEVDAEKYAELFKKNRLSSKKLQIWIKGLIQLVLKTRPLPSSEYKIKHTFCKVAQNIYVQDTDNCRAISIDFVPTIAMENFSTTVKNRIIKINMFGFGVPNDLMAFGPKCCRRGVFQIVNPTEERKLLWDKNNLKTVYRLLKSLRDNQKLPRLKSYFLTAAFLLEVEKQKDEFWLKPVGDLFIYMLKMLLEHFQGHNLPYYWAPEYNLLNILKNEETHYYATILDDVFYKLEKIALQKSVDLEQLDYFFKTSY